MNGATPSNINLRSAAEWNESPVTVSGRSEMQTRRNILKKIMTTMKQTNSGSLDRIPTTPLFPDSDFEN